MKEFQNSLGGLNHIIIANSHLLISSSLILYKLIILLTYLELQFNIKLRTE